MNIHQILCVAKIANYSAIQLKDVPHYVKLAIFHYMLHLTTHSSCVLTVLAQAAPLTVIAQNIYKTKKYSPSKQGINVAWLMLSAHIIYKIQSVPSNSMNFSDLTRQTTDASNGRQ